MAIEISELTKDGFFESDEQREIAAKVVRDFDKIGPQLHSVHKQCKMLIFQTDSIYINDLNKDTLSKIVEIYERKSMIQITVQI